MAKSSGDFKLESNMVDGANGPTATAVPPDRAMDGPAPEEAVTPGTAAGLAAQLAEAVQQPPGLPGGGAAAVRGGWSHRLMLETPVSSPSPCLEQLRCVDSRGASF